MKSRSTNHWRVVALLAAAALSMSSLPAFADHPEPAHAEDQVVVKLKPGGVTTIGEINATWGTSTLDLVLASRGIYLLQVGEGVDPATLAEDMGTDARLEYAEPNLPTYGTEFLSHFIYAWGDLLAAVPSTDPSQFSSQYAVEMLGLSDNLPTGAGVTVAVIDTGVQLTHPLLRDRITSARYDFVDDDTDPEDVGNGLDDDGDGLVDEAVGHGTHVASLVALVAPDAQIMPLRVLDSDGGGNTFVLAEALAFAAEHGVRVINLSLGSVNDSELIEDLIEELTEGGVVVVAAAGNSDSEQPLYPAASDEDVLAVAAIGPNYEKSPFSSYGSWVDLVAPGQQVYGAYPLDRWAWWGGTSLSAAMVSGQAALLFSVDSDLDTEEVGFLIKSTAVSVDSYNPDYPGLLGAGVPDPTRSIEALLSGALEERDDNNDDDEDDEDDD
ncbi:MAG: S8 family serine peptidase [Acidimicrobiia bacterium]